MINFIKRLKRKIFGPKLTPYQRGQARGRGTRTRTTRVDVIHDWYDDEDFKAQAGSQRTFMEQHAQTPTHHGDYDVESVKSSMSDYSSGDSGSSWDD